jgi:S-adenosylmethionine synthetase
MAHPLSINVETFGTGQLPDDELARLIPNLFDLRPGAILRDLDLRRPIYRPTAAYGHFGRTDLDLPWERLDRLAELKAEASITAEAAR